VLSTGDELVAPGEPVRGSQIRDVNTYTLSALLEGIGCTARQYGIMGDNLAMLSERAKEAHRATDALILSGGSSVGEKDVVADAIAALRAEFPERDIALVVDDRVTGANPKMNNLVNMMPAAKHDLLVISDSDMRVQPHYIRAIVAPFRSADVGATTCLYSGSARGGTVSEVGAMFINDWFFPSSLIALSFGELKFCFGATMAIRRDVLTQIDLAAVIRLHRERRARATIVLTPVENPIDYKKFTAN